MPNFTFYNFPSSLLLSSMFLFTFTLQMLFTQVIVTTQILSYVLSCILCICCFGFSDWWSIKDQKGALLQYVCFNLCQQAFGNNIQFQFIITLHKMNRIVHILSTVRWKNIMMKRLGSKTKLFTILLLIRYYYDWFLYDLYLYFNLRCEFFFKLDFCNARDKKQLLEIKLILLERGIFR